MRSRLETFTTFVSQGAERMGFLGRMAETLGTRTLSVIIGFLISVMIARSFGPEGRGLYATAVMVTLLAIELSNVGLPTANTHFVAQTPNLLPTLRTNALMMSVGCGGVAIGTLWAVSSFGEEWVALPSNLLGLIALWIPIGLAVRMLQHLMLGLHDVRAFNRSELIGKGLAAGLIGGVLLTDHPRIETAFGASLLASTIALFFLAARAGSFDKRAWVPSLDLLRTSLAYGLKAYGIGVCTFIITRIDLLLIASLLGAREAGFYAVAVSLADIVLMVPIVAGLLLFPKLSAVHCLDTMRHIMKQAMTGIGSAIIVMVGIAAVSVQPVVRLVYGDAFDPAVPAFWVLSPGLVMAAFHTLLMNAIAATGLPVTVVYILGLIALLNVCLNLTLIPLLGIVGAALTSSLSYGMMLLVSTYFYRRMNAQAKVPAL